MLETIYMLGMVGIFCAMLFYWYLAVKQKEFSIIPIILAIVSWFLSSFTHFELIKSVSTYIIQNSTAEINADLVAGGILMLSMNYYILILTILLTGVYVLTFIIAKAVSKVKKTKVR